MRFTSFVNLLKVLPVLIFTLCLQTEFFDTTSRGASFDYDAFLADIAKRPLSSSRRVTPRQEETVNPLYGQGKYSLPRVACAT